MQSAKSIESIKRLRVQILALLPACVREDVHVALMNHSFLLCKMRAVVKMDEIR